jgi:cytochrome c oxidase subunit 2
MKAGIAIAILAVVVVGTLLFVFVQNSSTTGNYVKIDSAATGKTVANNPSENAVVREFDMTANEFTFNPSTIEVNEGDTVILHITSVDVAHGIAIPEFNVTQDLPVGEETTVEFVASKKGTYSFHCNVFCGTGHREMTGTLVVN